MDSNRRNDLSFAEEMDRDLYSTFRTTANSLSQLYSQYTSMQRCIFEAGEKHALEKLERWMLTRQQEGLSVTAEDIYGYLQMEINSGKEASTSTAQPIHYSNHSPRASGETLGIQESTDTTMDDSVPQSGLFSPIRYEKPREEMQPPGVINIEDSPEQINGRRRMYFDINEPYNPDSPEYISD